MDGVTTCTGSGLSRCPVGRYAVCGWGKRHFFELMPGTAPRGDSDTALGAQVMLRDIALSPVAFGCETQKGKP